MEFPTPTSKVEFPHGEYGLWADDDDVIGLTVAETYPKGWPIVRTNPPYMDGFNEFDVGSFIAWCLSNAQFIAAANPSVVLELLDRIDAAESRIAELTRDCDYLAERVEP